MDKRTLFTGDNLLIMKGMESESVDLIYLDPPFNKKKVFTAPIGSSAEGASFSDIFKKEDVKDEWVQTIKEDNYLLYSYLNSIKHIDGRQSYNYCYLCYMAIRIIEMHRILKPTGSIYVHCDHTMSHYLKIMLDCIFGEKCFRNEVVWSYRTGGASKKWFGRKHDVIFFYTKSTRRNYTFHVLKERSYSTKNQPPGFKEIKKYRDDFGRWYTMSSLRDVWDINAIGRSSGEKLGYPTQKPLALLDRIIKVSSNEGDMVFDPFCGCATTLIAAEKLKRQWIGIDISPKAVHLSKGRVRKTFGDDLSIESINHGKAE